MSVRLCVGVFVLLHLIGKIIAEVSYRKPWTWSLRIDQGVVVVEPASREGPKAAQTAILASLCDPKLTAQTKK